MKIKNEAQQIVKALIDEFGMTAEQIAVKVDATASAIGYWRRGQKEPRQVYLKKLRRILERKTNAAQLSL